MNRINSQPSFHFIVFPMYLWVLMLSLQDPRGFQLGGIGKEQGGLSLLSGSYGSKVNAGHIESHCGALFNTTKW